MRLKTRLSRRPVDGSETGVFDAIPSSATRAVLEETDDGFDPEEAREEMRRSSSGGAVNRVLVMALGLGLLIAAGAAVIFGLQARSLTEQLQGATREIDSAQMQAPGSVQRYKLQMVKAKPATADLRAGLAHARAAARHQHRCDRGQDPAVSNHHRQDRWRAGDADQTHHARLQQGSALQPELLRRSVRAITW